MGLRGLSQMNRAVLLASATVLLAASGEAAIPWPALASDGVGAPTPVGRLATPPPAPVGQVQAHGAGAQPAARKTLPDLTSDQIAVIDRYVAEEMQQHLIPGMAVGIYSRGRILLAKGYGLANIELDVGVKPETIFQTGSIGKQFVSAAVMMLVEDGKIGLDDSIVKYFPKAPAAWRPILVKHLLSHTSGLAEYLTPELTGANGPFYIRLDFTEDELVEKFGRLPIEAKPAEVWAYSNTNYILLGVMIHKVTGKFWGDYLQDRIFKPLHMASTRVMSDSDIIPNRAAGYIVEDGRLRNQELWSPTFTSTADGTLYFTVLDVAKWDEALYGTTLLKPASLERLWTVFPMADGTPNAGHYGFGWVIDAVNGHRVIGHGGVSQGFTTQISRFVDDSLTVLVLTNLHPLDKEIIAHRIAGLVNPALMPPPPKQHAEHKAIAVDPRLMDRYVGIYQIAPTITLAVTRVDDRLYVQQTDRPVVQVFAEGERDFFVKGFDLQMTFVVDSEGKATELIVHQGKDYPAKRIK
jgi:CubicO group peptidase (beta-lactamase class C family)